jgi:hypothetical protein
MTCTSNTCTPTSTSNCPPGSTQTVNKDNSISCSDNSGSSTGGSGSSKGGGSSSSTTKATKDDKAANEGEDAFGQIGMFPGTDGTVTPVHPQIADLNWTTIYVTKENDKVMLNQTEYSLKDNFQVFKDGSYTPICDTIPDLTFNGSECFSDTTNQLMLRKTNGEIITGSSNNIGFKTKTVDDGFTSKEAEQQPFYQIGKDGRPILNHENCIRFSPRLLCLATPLPPPPNQSNDGGKPYSPFPHGTEDCSKIFHVNARCLITQHNNATNATTSTPGLVFPDSGDG